MHSCIYLDFSGKALCYAERISIFLPNIKIDYYSPIICAITPGQLSRIMFDLSLDRVVTALRLLRVHAPPLENEKAPADAIRPKQMEQYEPNRYRPHVSTQNLGSQLRRKGTH